MSHKIKKSPYLFYERGNIGPLKIGGDSMATNYEEDVQEIVKCYFTSKKQCMLTGLSNGEEDYYNPYFQFYRRVEVAFSKLNYDEKLIINNDFFYNDYYGWWKIVFSKTEYLRKRRSAIRNFRRHVYES